MKRILAVLVLLAVAVPVKAETPMIRRFRRSSGHVCIVYDGRFGETANIGLFRNGQCDHDYSMALVRTRLRIGERITLYHPELVNWTGYFPVAPGSYERPSTRTPGSRP